MKIQVTLWALMAVAIALMASAEHEREKRQASTLALPAGVAYLAFWSLVTLRLLALASRVNQTPQAVTTPSPLQSFRLQPNSHPVLVQQQQHPVLTQQQHPVLAQQQQHHPVVFHPPQQHHQPQQNQANHRPIIVNLPPIVVNTPTETTTQKSGYVNSHVKRSADAADAMPSPTMTVDKMLQAIRGLDKSNCVPLLICQLYAKRGKQQTMGSFEQSVIQFVEEYNGPGVQKGGPGAIFKAAAVLGKSEKSTTKCAQVFAKCPVNADQMATIFKSTEAP